MAAQIRLTLQNRVAALMVLFTIIFIVVFLTIQLRNQLSTITGHNTYRSSLAAIIAKNAFEKAIVSSEGQDPSPFFHKTFKALQATKIMEHGAVIDPSGAVLASTELYERGSQVGFQESQAVERALKNLPAEKLFLSRIERGSSHLYIPVRSPGNARQYVVRLSFSLGNLRDAMVQVYKPAILSAILVVLANILLGWLLSKMVIGPIRVLNVATKDIAAGNLDLRVKMPTNDELEELADTFNDMTVALKKMKERAENANPLTKLPGNTVIHEEIDKRLTGGEPFVVVYSDLDNFKAFNDKYGISAGDVAIKMTAQVMREAMEKHGMASDFIGHEGGDDFLLLIGSERYEAVVKYICAEFDRRAREMYSPEDRERGFIMEKNRQGVLCKFGLMTISLAGISNLRRKLSSYAEITNIAAEMKHKVKGMDKSKGSVFALDQRSDEEIKTEARSTPSTSPNA